LETHQAGQALAWGVVEELVCKEQEMVLGLALEQRPEKKKVQIWQLTQRAYLY